MARRKIRGKRRSGGDISAERWYAEMRGREAVAYLIGKREGDVTDAELDRAERQAKARAMWEGKAERAARAGKALPARKWPKKLTPFGAHGSATYAVAIKGDWSAGYTSRRKVQGDVQAIACGWRRDQRATSAVVVREAARGTARAIYACIPRVGPGFPRLSEGESCGCTASRALATRTLNRLRRK